MLIKEYHVLMPLSQSEFEIGQLYAVAEVSKQETGGGQGVEVLVEEPFQSDTVRPGHDLKGTYTKKIYHLREKAPWFLRKIFAKEAFDLCEDSWNAYPYTKTVITNPGYMKDNFTIIIESLHVDDDNGSMENALDLSPELLKKREVVMLDIYNSAPLKKNDITSTNDPRTFHSSKTGRGPLKADWSRTTKPIMCAYKVCQVTFKKWGFQNRVEKYLQNSYPRLFIKFHREAFCLIDKWVEMSVSDVIEHGKKTTEELKNDIKKGKVKGMSGGEEESTK